MPSPQVSLKPIGFDENSAPDNFAGLANSFQCSTTEREIHRRLPLTRCTAITAHAMIRWGGSRNFEDPDKFVIIYFAKTNIVQRVFRIKIQLLPDTVCDKRI